VLLAVLLSQSLPAQGDPLFPPQPPGGDESVVVPEVSPPPDPPASPLSARPASALQAEQTKGRAKQFLPVQADVSGGGSVGPSSQPTLEMFVGAVYGVSHPPWGTPFAALGGELTFGFGNNPYRVAYGAQLRLGYAWAEDRGNANVHPDVMLFVQVTPFAASARGPGEGNLIGRAGDALWAGARIGVGMTAPLWTRTCLGNKMFADEHGLYGDTLRMLIGLLLTPVGLLNHAEIGVEMLNADPFSTAITFRVGSGF
jgi:hypothetical protein